MLQILQNLTRDRTNEIMQHYDEWNQMKLQIYKLQNYNLPWECV